MRSFLGQLSHKIDLPSSRNLVGILLEGMADLADKMAANTCETEKLEESGSFKRAIQDDDQLTDEASNKKLKIAEPAEQVTEDGNTEKANVIPRRKKCALLLSYCGVGYNGMQMNPGVRTIEEELVNSLYKAEAITVDGKECMGKMSFQRCARTDKGVSAARQVVSLKMVPLESILPSINEHLPPEIRVVAMKRTTRGFDAKATCSGRTYEYLTPTYAFAKEYQTSASYRVTAEKIEEANKVLAKFLGTHNYHNFTSGKRFNDASAKRYIMKFKCGKPFEKDGREFIVMSVKGQSFMLHQIRKMIGLALAIVRGIAPISTIELAKQEKKVDIPKAPAVGLVLDQVHFESYNRRYGSDGIHETLEWEDYEEEIQQFKDKFIYKHITDTEAKDHVMLRWLKTLPDHTYTDERMEEIQAKPVRDARQSTKTENTSDQLNSAGGSSGSKHSMEGGMDDDVCNAGGTSDLKQSMKGGGNGGRKTSMEGGERDEVSIAGKTSDLKHPMEGRESGELCDAGGRGDLEQVIECGEIGNEEVQKEVAELEETPAALKVSNGGGSLTESLEVKQEQANL